MKTKARIVTYCHEGRDLKELTDNKSRLAMLNEVAATLHAHPEWHPIDAVVFPGGFLSELPHNAARSFLKQLERLSPGLQLVIGVDKDGEQLALAFNKQGLSGYARKIFPVGEDVDGKTFAPITLHEEDYNDARRIITLANGQKALLCVCYDMFGFSDALRGETNRLSKAVLVQDSAGQIYDAQNKGEKSKGLSVLRKAFNAHRDMLLREKPDLAIATIHRFSQAGRDGFWQRHGIASASASLEKGLAVSAAHFGKLPPHENSSPLAASGVPRAHLKAGGHRQAHALAPNEGVTVRSGKEKGLLRLFG